MLLPSDLGKRWENTWKTPKMNVGNGGNMGILVKQTGK